MVMTKAPSSHPPPHLPSPKYLAVLAEQAKGAKEDVKYNVFIQPSLLKRQ